MKRMDGSFGVLARSVVPDVHQDARDFIRARGLSAPFDRVQQLVLRCFPTLCALGVALEVDPEIPDCQHVCFEATVRGSVEQVLDWEDDFCAAFCGLLEPDERESFALTTTMAEE